MQARQRREEEGKVADLNDELKRTKMMTNSFVSPRQLPSGSRRTPGPNLPLPPAQLEEQEFRLRRQFDEDKGRIERMYRDRYQTDMHELEERHKADQKLAEELWQQRKESDIRALQLTMEGEFNSKLRQVESTWERRMAESRMKSDQEVASVKIKSKEELDHLKRERTPLGGRAAKWHCPPGPPPAIHGAELTCDRRVRWLRRHGCRSA